jgi:hypothetical protein
MPRLAQDFREYLRLTVRVLYAVHGAGASFKVVKAPIGVHLQVHGVGYPGREIGGCVGGRIVAVDPTPAEVREEVIADVLCQKSIYPRAKDRSSNDGVRVPGRFPGYLLTLKVQILGWSPMVLGSWSSAVPARSSAAVVTVAM